MRYPELLSRRVRPALLGIAVGLALLPASASGSPAATADGRLVVGSLGSGTQTATTVSFASSDPVTKVRLSVPVGYTVALDRSPGTVVGFVLATLADVTGSSFPAFVDGEVVVDDPARYATDPAAQACAAGTHAAVWRATFAVLGQSFDLPIFLDQAGPTDPGSAVQLQLCPAWPSPSAATGVAARSLSLLVEGVVTPPTAQGRYTWSASVTPGHPGSIAPNAEGVFELRSIIPYPHTLTLRARHDPTGSSVVLSGRLTAAGEPEARAEISFAAETDSISEVTFFGPVTTNAAGEFTVRRRVEQTTLFMAAVDATTRPCSAPSSAPGGCAETVSPPSSASALVRVRAATDPKLTPRRRDQALARRINLTRRDFPAGWRAFETFPVFSCRGFQPKLSDLNVTGDFASPAFASSDAVVSSRAAIYVTEAQARTAFGREARIASARCIARELQRAGARVLQLGAVAFPRLGTETRAFRLVASDGEDVLNLDLVSFRQGRAVVHLGFASLVQPMLIARDLAAKVAARARGA